MKSVSVFLFLTLASWTQANRYFDADGLTYNYTVGDLTLGVVSQTVPPNDGSNFITTNYSFNVPGVVTTISYRTHPSFQLPSNQKVHLQAWRHDGGDNYQLVASIQHIPTASGINQVGVKMAVEAGDLLGFSCKPVCPIAKDEAQTSYKVLIRMSRPSDRLNVGDVLSFTEAPIRAKIGLQASIEANGVMPPITTTAVSEPSSSSRGEGLVSTIPPTVPTLPSESPQSEAQSDGAPDSWGWQWIVVIIAASVGVVLVVAVIIACIVCQNYRLRYQYKHRQLEASIAGSRPVSMITNELPSTLGRNPGVAGMHHSNEIEVTNQDHPATAVTDIYAVVKKPRPTSTAHPDEEPIVIFDNGTTNRPPPPTSPPPVTEL